MGWASTHYPLIRHFPLLPAMHSLSFDTHMALKKKSVISDNLFEETDDLSLENEDDLGSISKTALKQAVVFSTDWTTDVLIQQLKKGNIDLDPAFQRRDAWTTKRKSLFIESLILGLPVPQIVLAEKKGAKGSFLVIDGKQRLLSLLRFTQTFDEQPPFHLSDLKLRHDLNGYSFEDLKSKGEDFSSFENQTVRTVVIRNWQKEDILYLIFHRLNSETLPLSPQELRQALHPGPFLVFCDKHSQNSLALRRILRLKKPDFRMRDVELLVRFFAFKNFTSSYSGNLKDFLDDACKELNRNWKTRQSSIQNQIEQFEEAVEAAYEIFEGSPFRKWDGGHYEGRFNRAIFDVVMYYLSDPKIRKASLSSADAVLGGFKSLCLNDNSFIRSVETTTKSKNATSTRFNRWASSLSTSLQLKIKPPALHE
jgi:hypothetical protein